MKKIFFKPSHKLQPYIDRYINYKIEQTESLLKLLPGTGEELFINLGNEIILGGDNRTHIRTSSAFLLSLRDTSIPVYVPKEMNLLSIRFKSGMIRHFTSFFPKEFYNSIIPIEDIWNNSGTRFCENVLFADSNENKIKIIEEHLIQFISKYYKDDSIVDLLATSLYYNFNNTSIKDFSDQLNFSQRTLERKFNDVFNLSPKKYQRITKTMHTVKFLLLNNVQDYLSTVLNFGYYDQAHFIKEFKKFTGEKPSDFLQPNNFLSNFYNRSWNSKSNFHIHL